MKKSFACLVVALAGLGLVLVTSLACAAEQKSNVLKIGCNLPLGASVGIDGQKILGAHNRGGDSNGH